MKKIVIVNLLLFLLIILTAQPSQSDTSDRNHNQNRSIKRIVVGGEIDYPPYSFVDENGNPAGFLVELTRAVARSMNIDIEIRLDKWPLTRKALDEGSVDIIIGMFYSDERAKIYDFSPPYIIISDAIFARKNSPPVASIDDLRNKELIIMRGEVMHDYVLEHKLSDRLLLVETPSDAVKMLSSGKGDYALIAQMPGYYWIDKYKLSNVAAIGPLIAPFKTCFVSKKGNTALLSCFTEGLLIVNRNGTYRDLYEKWLSVLEPAKISFRTVAKYLIIALLPVLLLLGVSLLWSWSLSSRVNERTKDLYKSREILNLIINTVPQSIFWKDVNSTYLGCNRMFALSAGLNDPKEIEGKTDYDLPWTREDSEAYRSDDRDVIENNHEKLHIIEQLQQKDGSRIWIDTSKVPLRDSNGHPFAVLGVYEDISSRKLHEEQMQKALKEKEILITEIHHRVKNNMAIISSLLELQSMSTANETAKQLLKESKQRIRTMALVHEKLYKSNDFISIEVDDYVRDLVKDIISFYGEKAGSITTRIQVEPIQLDLDTLIPVGLIVNELVTNSVKHAFKNSVNPYMEVKIYKDENNMVHLHAVDNGCGFDSSQNLSDYQTFGLLIVYGLIEQLSGKYTLNSSLGTAYEIVFPAGDKKI